MLEDTETDYFEAPSSAETYESGSGDISGNEGTECLTQFSADHSCESGQEVMPILIKNRLTETSRCHVQIQSPIKVSKSSRKVMPRTPIPGYTDPHGELTQSEWRKLESKQEQKPELQMSNSSMLRRRGARSVAI